MVISRYQASNDGDVESQQLQVHAGGTLGDRKRGCWLFNLLFDTADEGDEGSLTKKGATTQGACC
jgi:hypothetical protein